MCGIVISGHKRLDELVNQNLNRGSKRFSMSAIALRADRTLITQSGDSRIKADDFLRNIITHDARHGDHVLIAHNQAPTAQNAMMDGAMHHPAISYDGRFALWHNGVMLPEFMAKHDVDSCGWDTQVMADVMARTLENRGIADYGKTLVSAISEFKGSFACVLYDVLTGHLYVFRNESAPLYYNKQWGISSAKPILRDRETVKYRRVNFEEIPAGVIMDIEYLTRTQQIVMDKLPYGRFASADHYVSIDAVMGQS